MGRIRKRSRREIADPFGLSTLDTVTCALGGAIVIMLLQAAIVHPSAPLSVERTVPGLEAHEASAADPGAEAAADGGEDSEADAEITIAHLHLVFPKPVQMNAVTASCGEVSVSIVQTRDAPSNFDLASATTHALTLRLPSGNRSNACRHLPVSLNLPPSFGASCEVTLVSGGMFQQVEYPRGCPAVIDLHSNEGQVFFLRKRP